MAPQTGTALLIFLAFVLPGFVTVLIKERTHETGRDTTQLDRILRVGYYSVWSYLVLALIALVFQLDRGDGELLWERHRDNPALLVVLGAAAVILPSLLIANVSRLWDGSRAHGWVRDRLRINVRHQTPTAWDHFFLQRSEAMVRATLRDGRVVGGYYGPRSLAAYAKDGRDLYLEQRWVMTKERAWFQEVAADTSGLWLPTEEVVSLEFYTPNRDES